MVGVMEFTTRPITFLCRFDPPITLGDATEVDLPTRFLFFALGVSSQSTLWQMCEMGRAMALLLTDKVLLIIININEDIYVSLRLRKFHFISIKCKN